MRNYKIILGLLAALLLPVAASANSAARGWCEIGAQTVTTSGLTSTTQVQASYPGCSITVIIHGGGAATIYSDNANTPLANPFTSTLSGQWTFFAANGRYDITLSGGGLPSSVTYSDVVLFDAASVGGVLTSAGSPAANQVTYFTSASQVTGTPTDTTPTHALFTTAGAPAFRQPTLTDIAGGTAPAGTYNFSGVTLIQLRAGATLTTSTNGDVGYDTTNKNWHGFANGVDSLFATIPTSVGVANEDCADWDNVAGTISLADFGSPCVSLSLPNTWTSSQTFSAAMNANAGGTLNGTFGGPTTLSGTLTSTGQILCKNIENTRCVDASNSGGWAGSDVSAWIASAQADLIGSSTNGGIIDARGAGGALVYSSGEIDIGTTTKPVILLLPCVGNWTATMTGGTSNAIKWFDKSSIIGCGSGEGEPFTIYAGATSNLASVCGNDPTAKYFRVDGWACGALNGATVSSTGAVLHINSMQDESYVGHMTASTSSTTANKILWIHGTCCSNVIEMVNAEGFGTAGAVPCTFGNGTVDANQGMTVRSISCVHPGNGLNNFIDVQNSPTHVGNIFEGIYMEETAGQDLTTPFAAVTAPSAPSATDTFIGLNGSLDIASSTRYVLDIASGAHVTSLNLNIGTVSTNAINDHNAGKGPITGAVNSTISYYSTESSSYVSSLQSSFANRASLGLIRLAHGDAINWRNNANNADIGLSLNVNDFMSWSGAGGFGASSFVQPLGTGATSGFIQMASGDQIGWRNAANNGNLFLSHTALDQLSWPNAIVPTVAGAADLGSSLLPYGNLWLGTAATNNFKFQPASTTGARIITMADPLSPTTVAMPMTIGNGTAAMTTAGIAAGACGTTVTVAATGVLTTDTIDVSHNAAATNGNGGNLILNWWPTAGNVNFNYCNPSAGIVTPTAMTVNWSVRRP